jgi:hypothetical protein
MKVLLDIPDKNADSFMDVLRHISFVKIQPFDTLKYQVVEDELEEPNKEEILEGLREAIHEVKEHIAGRKKLRTVKELLAELRGDSL